jgi:hypothetical protein
MTYRNIIGLPAATTFTADQALNSALNIGMQDVMVIGYDEAGSLVIRSSRMTCAEAAFLANKAFQWAVNGGQD